MKNSMTARVLSIAAASALALTGLTPASLADTAEDGLLRTAILYDISTLDVARTTDNYMVPMNVFDRLFETRMIDGTAQLVGSLCTDYSVSADGLTYAFSLREGVVFSNGSALTASDVKYSFERLLLVNMDNTDIPLEIVGADAVTEGRTDSLEGFTVTDDTHFTVTLNAPNAGFIAELSAPAMSIVDAESMADAVNFGIDPAESIGTGPYTVTEWITNDHYTLEYNPLYWGSEPSVKKVIVRVIPDAGTQNLMFQNGELDLIDLQSLDTAIVESFYKTVYPDRIVSTPKVGLTFFALNENNAYLSDPNVRRAIGMAIDTDSLIDGFYYGNAVREHGIIPTGIWGHNDSLEEIAFDPDGARALLAEAGYGSGEVHFEMAMSSSATGNIQLIYYSISQMLSDVGIRAEVKSYDQAAWLDKRRSGEIDSLIGTWGMDYNDPANIMYTFFGGPKKTAERSLNYPDTDVMARVAAASAIVDDDLRREEYQALEKKIIVEDAAWIPLFAELHLYCMGERLESFTPHWAGFTDFYAIDAVLR